MVLSLYTQYGFSEWKRHRNQHSHLEKDTEQSSLAPQKRKVSRDNQSKVSMSRFL